MRLTQENTTVDGVPRAGDDRFAVLLLAIGDAYWELSEERQLVVRSPLLPNGSDAEFRFDGALVEQLLSCIDPGDMARLRAAEHAAALGGERFETVFQFRGGPDDSPRWLRVRGRRAAREGGRSPLCGTLSDVTAERETARELAELNRHLREAQSLAGIGSWTWNVATGDVKWSEETYRLFQVPLEAAPSFELVMSFAIDDEHRARFLALVQSALEHGTPYDFEIPTRRPDGSLMTIHTRGTVERDANGVPVRMTGTMQDVTEIRGAQQALMEREARFRTLAESSPAGVFLTDERGVPTYVNQRLLDWFEQSFEEFVSGGWRTCIHPDHISRVSDRSSASEASGAKFEETYPIVVGGATRWIEVRTERVFDANGTLRGQVGSVFDVSAERFAAAERARLREQLQQAQRLEALGLLAGGIAHDFNNLLVGILANATSARNDVGAGNPVNDTLADIEHAAKRAAELTHQLLAMGGRANVLKGRVNLLQLARELPSLLGARIPASIVIEIEGPDTAGMVSGDETQLRQVLMNLLTNAVDAIGVAPGSIRVTVAREEYAADALSRCVLGVGRTPGAYVVVSITDSGLGMPPHVVKRMFDPFFTTKSEGRGLGLAATLGILNSHDGAIDVVTTEGGGTTVRVLLPFDESSSAAAAAISTPDAPFVGTGTILIVDDEPSVRGAARRVLVRAGFAVLEAVDGADALRVFDAHDGQVSAALIDVSMPNMNGAECLAHLRARRAMLPVLMSSGYDAEDTAQRMVARGEAGFLQKPYTAAALVDAVRRMLEV